ncbi:ABC transporter permease [Paenibacillus sp. GD4]|jgi:putative tryptophan/tyrosine transport system permease protein|uniref:ABC transporter permease n=1 Tax=Paenibacillus TaxID=44249 RepID=UPI002542F8AF|nr:MULTISPECIES: ABC transporter permease [Paenibacillus]MDQ1908925.1 ABC transporter permease [Paenibacillus sp. GD4]
MLDATIGSLELGLLYAIMALGVYITFRILDFPDLTVDGSFTTGGAIAAVMITGGSSPLLATAAAFCGGIIAGACTGLLHTKGKINALLSGILMMIALYSINLRIMGKKSNISMLGVDTLLSDANVLLVMPIIVLVVKLGLDWFFRTDLGLALRATGDNQRMIRSFGVNTDSTIIVGVSLSNGLVAMSGALIAQYSAFAEITMGVGMIVIGLASVIIGEAIFGARTIVRATLAVIFGAIIYRLVVAVALRVGLEATDMKLMTALIVIVALMLPMINKSYKQKALVRKRMSLLQQPGTDTTVDGGTK